MPCWMGGRSALAQLVRCCCTHRYNPARVDVVGVHCYSSRDLETWHDEGGYWALRTQQRPTNLSLAACVRAGGLDSRLAGSRQALLAH